MDDFNKTPYIYPNLNAILSNEQQFRLNKINEIEDHFSAEIRERKLISIASMVYKFFYKKSAGSVDDDDEIKKNYN